MILGINADAPAAVSASLSSLDKTVYLPVGQVVWVTVVAGRHQPRDWRSGETQGRAGLSAVTGSQHLLEQVALPAGYGRRLGYLHRLGAFRWVVVRQRARRQ